MRDIAAGQLAVFQGGPSRTGGCEAPISTIAITTIIIAIRDAWLVFLSESRRANCFFKLKLVRRLIAD
jgi:hypothetical protein